jgi:hypothetical protein
MCAALLASFVMLGAAGCAEEADNIETTQGAVVTWTNLQLLNNWQSYGPGYTPQVAIIDGAVTFKGALKGPNANSDVAFKLDGPTFSAFRTIPPDGAMMRTVMKDDVGGTIFVQLTVDGSSVPVHIVQDGVAANGIGPKAREFTSLDGVAFDQQAGSVLVYNYDHWRSKYGFRQSPLGACTGQFQDCGVYAKLQGGFVRLQGVLQARDIDDFDGNLFTLPSSLRTGQMVTVPVTLGGDSPPNQRFGILTVYPDGNVSMSGDPLAAVGSLAFDGVAYSKTNTGNVPLPLASNWVAYSSRQVKVGNFGGVVRFQGAIKNGNSIQLATVPAGLRPSKTVRVVGDIFQSAWQVTIIIEPTGFMWFQGAPLNYAATYLSLDSVSYPL